MFLRNYYNMMARLSLNLRTNANGNFGDSSLVFRTNNGNLLRELYPGGSSPSASSMADYIPAISELSIWSGEYAYFKVIAFGSGNEPVTFEDYTLGTLLHNQFKYNLVSTSGFNYDENTKKYSVQTKYTLSNITSDIITIREYGIFCGQPSYNTGILIFRDLIEPYALQPSESVNVVLNTSYTMPTIDESGNVVAGSQAYGLSIE